MTVRALTIRQPHASLVAVGAKTIETRGFATSYRGPLLIHAGLDYSAMYRWYRGWHATDVAMAIPGIMLHESFLLGYAGRNGYRRKPTFTIYGAPLPLGAVVASCQLIGCIPIVSWAPLDGPPAWAAHMIPRDDADPDTKRMILVRDAEVAAECLRDGPLPAEIDATDQLPFGDFSPGRYAWLLDDVKPTTERCPRCWGSGFDPDAPPTVGNHYHPCPPCDGNGRCAPVPMRGRQGLWTPAWETAA